MSQHQYKAPEYNALRRGAFVNVENGTGYTPLILGVIGRAGSDKSEVAQVVELYWNTERIWLLGTWVFWNLPHAEDAALKLEII